jgi:large subunit ribosomal protein L35
MPKMKSHSGAKKRFKRTSSGKWVHKKAGLMHLLTPSRSKRGRQSRRPDVLNNVEGEIVRKFLPYN